MVHDMAPSEKIFVHIFVHKYMYIFPTRESWALTGTTCLTTQPSLSSCLSFLMREMGIQIEPTSLGCPKD